MRHHLLTEVLDLRVNFEEQGQKQARGRRLLKTLLPKFQHVLPFLLAIHSQEPLVLNGLVLGFVIGIRKVGDLEKLESIVLQF